MFINTLASIGIAQAFFIIIVVLLQSKKIANYILCGWITIIGMIMALGLFKQQWGMPFVWPITLCLYIAFNVSMFLYTKYIVDTYAQFRLKDLLHFLPSLFIIIFLCFTLDSSWLTSPTIEPYTRKYYLFSWTIRQYYVGAVVVYTYLSFKKIIRFRQQIKDSYSYISPSLKLDWLSMALIINLVYTMLISLMGINLFFNWFDAPTYELVTSCMTLTILYLLGIGGIIQPQLTMVYSHSTNQQTEIDKIADNTNEENKAKHLQMESNSKCLIAYIEEQKAWHDPELSIAKLSKATGIPKHIITQALNEYLGKNFYTLINEYRINEAMRMIRDEKYKNWTFMAIAYECGFNSKTAFYTVFKKITNTTPTEYRNKVLK